jgi:uncharacterized protein YbcI
MFAKLVSRVLEKILLMGAEVSAFFAEDQMGTEVALGILVFHKNISKEHKAY